MEMKIAFFENQIAQAIGGGVYQISLRRAGGREAVLYIGESYSMLNRCAEHLYAFRNDPAYFGLEEVTLVDDLPGPALTLIAEILAAEPDKSKCQQLELHYIAERNPLTQSGIKDRMKDRDEKIKAVSAFLNS